MSKVADTPALPRPVEPLPDYANATARKNLGDKLVESFKLSRGAAMAIANAVVDPAAVRKGLGEPTDPNAERIHVPGGDLLGIRTPVWGRKVIPDPRNPRTLPVRKHPFAVDPGSGKEDSRFRPVPEPRTPQGVAPTTAELVVDIESRHHLTWAMQQARDYVRANNDWTDSIKMQGVMEAVWLVPTTYRHGDGADPVTALTSAEGSSRITGGHAVLEVTSSDVPYDDADAKFRAHLQRLNKALVSGTATPKDTVMLRCERVPALIIVGFAPYKDGATGFPTALKSLVALRHVDRPTPWGEGPENESLADEVLDEMERRGLISRTRASYLAGSCTRDEALAAHFSNDPVIRAAEIVRLFTNPSPEFKDAIRAAVTSQSTRKNVNQALLNALATALILRAVSKDPSVIEQVRRYLRKAFGKAVHAGAWDPTGRDVDKLLEDALGEIRAALATDHADEPCPSTLELAVRSAFPLILDGRLSGDRGTLGNTQPDRREPGEVLDAMRQTQKGLHQLAQALRDYSLGRPIRAVDEEGAVSVDEDGSDRIVSDTYLRTEFPPAGGSKARRPGNTPTDHYLNSVSALARAMQEVGVAFDALGKVAGDDGRLMVDIKGVDVRDCAAWRELLGRMDDDFVVWSRTYRRVNGVDAVRREPEAFDEGADAEGEKQDVDETDDMHAALETEEAA